MITRRRFLVSLPAFAAASRLAVAQRFLPKKKPVAPPPVFVYFGTDTTKGISKGIYESRFDPATGKLTAPALIAATPRPTFLALSAAGHGERHLYAVNAMSGAQATVTSFTVDPAAGTARQLNQVSSAGDGPCYISLDRTGRAAFVANYNGSSIASYRVLPNGALSPPVTRIDFKGPRYGARGPNAARQDVPHPHSVMVSPDNRFLIVNDLGRDAISVFSIHPDTAELTQAENSLFLNNRPGSGPRHIAFHPNGRWVYSINELDSTIDLYLWTTARSATAPEGLLVNADKPVKLLAAGFPVAKNTAAEVAISPDGKFLYASNRGEDTLVVFTIAPADGTLTLLQRIPCGGRGPRHFTLDPSGKWLLCGNQDSATIAVFRRDPATGRLNGPVETTPLDSPMFTLFA